MSRDAGASAFTVVTKPVVLADDLVSPDATEWGAAMKADIFCCSYRAVGEAIDYDSLIEKPRRVGTVGYCVRKCYRIPERTEYPPVSLVEGTLARKNRLAGDIACQLIRAGNKGYVVRHGNGVRLA
jgi:hypothetical protein